MTRRTLMTTVVDFVCARVRHAEAPDSRGADLIDLAEITQSVRKAHIRTGNIA